MTIIKHELNLVRNGDNKMKLLKRVLIYILFLSTSVLSQSVLILEDNGTEDSVYSILTSNDINTTLGGNYWEYTGAGINQYILVIFLNGVDWGEPMDSTVQQIICDYVFSGGKLLTTEWISWGEYDYYPLIYQIIPVIYDGDYGYDEEMYYKKINHPVGLSLPDSFIVPSDWSYAWTVRDTASSKQAITIFAGSLSGDAVVLGRYGTGEIIHWNMAGQYDGNNIWSPETKTLLINIVRYMLNIVNVDEDISLPKTFALYPNYPNPFNPSTKISWQAPIGSRQTLKVYDVLGNEVATLVDEYKPAGMYNVQFTINNLASGLYFYQLKAGDYIQTKKMMYLK
jgi:Secretion system C-terminal sorting domain